MSRPDPTDSTAADRAAVAQVIHDETAAFQREDFDAWSACWLHDPRTQDVCMSRTAGLSIHDGWDSVSEAIRNVFAEGLNCGVLDFGQQNLRITVSGDIAWAHFDSWAAFGTGGRGTSHETRILERHDGRWKIVFSSFFLEEVAGPAGLSVAVDGEGRVVRTGSEATAALKSHPILTVSAGRLRAHRRDWDKALQAAIRRAGQHHGFFQTHKFANDMGGPADLPVVLGQTDEGGVAVVQMSIRDGVTHVFLDQDGRLDRRLDAARTVFGLSETQVRVARRIALGQSLREAAEDLGVSVNTARTHLTRLFAKTGVNSQAALVRLLLSVA